MGTYLVADHDLAEAGCYCSHYERGQQPKPAHAPDLYLAGYADLILMAQTPHGSLELDPETGILSAGETERSRLILLDLGIPEEGIVILPNMTRSTRDEAEAQTFCTELTYFGKPYAAGLQKRLIVQVFARGFPVDCIC